MTTPLRWIYGNSNRSGHLRMAASLALVTPTAGLMFAPWIFPDPSLWLLTPIAIFMHEHWATSDRDVEPSRKGGISHVYWYPYGALIGHRSIWSHGLVVGTAGRLVYGWWFWLPVLWWYWPWLAIAWAFGCFVADLGHWLLDL
jgi:uncharacterized metal-binding protein